MLAPQYPRRGRVNRLLMWASAALLGAAGTLHAAPQLDLLEGYRLALQNDRQLRIARARSQSSGELVSQATAQFLPSVSASMARNRIEQQRNDGGQVGQTQSYPSSADSITLRQSIYRPRLTASLSAAQAQAEQGEANLAKEEQAAGVRLVQGYLDALLAQDRLQLLDAQLKNVQARLDSARMAVKAGTGVRTDVDEAQAQLDRIRAQEVQFRHAATLALKRLEVIVGQPVYQLAPLRRERFLLGDFEAGSFESWLERAFEKSPEIQGYKARQEAAQAGVRVARSGHLPTVDLVAQYSKSTGESAYFINTQTDARSIGVQLTIPIYQGGLVNSQVRQAEADSAESEEQLQNAKDNLRVQVAKEYNAVISSVAMVRALEQALLSAEQMVLSSRKGVQAGTRSALDVFLVEKQKFEVEVEYAQVRYDLLAGWVRLLSLAGMLDQEAFTKLARPFEDSPPAASASPG